jgi:chromosomal replication initiation ATPase DnaA
VAEEDYLVAECNAEAVNWLDRWPEWPTRVVVLHGPPGCGKTHLSHVFADRSGGTIVDDRAFETDELIDVAARASACIVDDADIVVARHEAPLLHLYNAVCERGGYLLLTASAPPARWPVRLADLRSRLNTATPVGIGMPDEALIAGLLVKLFADRRLQVTEDVVLYSLARMDRSFDAARRLVANLDRMALGQHRRITIQLLREVLQGSGESA